MRRGSTLRDLASSSSTTALPTCPASRGPALSSTATEPDLRHLNTTELPTRYQYRDKTVTTELLLRHSLLLHLLLLQLLPWLRQLHLWLRQHRPWPRLLQLLHLLHLQEVELPLHHRPQLRCVSRRVLSPCPDWPQLCRRPSSRRLTESRLRLVVDRKMGLQGRKDQL